MMLHDALLMPIADSNPCSVFGFQPLGDTTLNDLFGVIAQSAGKTFSLTRPLTDQIMPAIPPLKSRIRLHWKNASFSQINS